MQWTKGMSIILVLIGLFWSGLNTVKFESLHPKSHSGFTLEATSEPGVLTQYQKKSESFSSELIDFDITLSLLKLNFICEKAQYSAHDSHLNQSFKFVHSGPSPPDKNENI